MSERSLELMKKHKGVSILALPTGYYVSLDDYDHAINERDRAREEAETQRAAAAGYRAERDEAREVARDFWPDLQHMGDYLFNKHYGDYAEQYPWLKDAAND